MEYKLSYYNLIVANDSDHILLFNSNSGALVEFTIEEYQMLQDLSCDDAKKEFLCSLGFLVPKNKDEYNQILLHEQALVIGDDNTNRLVYVIAPTLDCNMHCIYCFENNKDFSAKMNAETEELVYKYIESNVRSLNQVTSVHITWFGGEPLLCLDTIKRLSKRFITLCRENKVKYDASIITNGLLLTKNIAEELFDLRVKRAQITIDGTMDVYCANKGATPEMFSKVIDNIKQVCKVFDVNIRLNCTEENIQQLIDVVNIFDKNEEITFYLAPVKNYNRDMCTGCSGVTDEQFEISSQLLLEKCGSRKVYPAKRAMTQPIGTSCALIRAKNAAIGPKGELYNCEHHLGISDKIIGDVKTGLYYTDDYIKSTELLHPKECRECKIFPICLSGCQSDLHRFGISKLYCKMKNDSLLKQLKEKHLAYENKRRCEI